MRRLLLSSIFFSVVGIFSLSLPPNLPAENAAVENIKIGAIINLTGPGVTRGHLSARGMKDYFRYINETSLGISGRKIDLTIVDGGDKVSDALKYVKKFCTSEKMDVVATWDAHVAITAKPIFVKHKVSHMSFSNCPDILHAPVSYTYLPFGSAILDCHAILQYIETTHDGSAPPKVGLLTSNDTYGKSIHGPSEAYASNHSLEIVAILQFPPHAPDLETEMLKLKNMGVEYIVMQCPPSDIITALQSADHMKYHVPFFGAWTCTGAELFDRGKGLIRNRLRVSFPGCLPGDGVPGIQMMMVLMERYKSVFKFDTAYWEGISIAAIMARGVQKAYEKLGKIDGQTVNLAFETFEKEDFGGLIPNITYTDTNHGASFTTRIIRVNENQTFTPLTKFWNPKTDRVTIIQ